VQRMRIRWSDGSVQPITANGVDRVIDVVPLERR
jgi:hypothetical protein